MTLLYVLPWIGWVAWFVLWEAIGFRRGNDRWPTLSGLVKWIEWHDNDPTRGVEGRGLVFWTWRRWLVAVGLPILGIVLELHWVLEVF
jgi:hypothetical protein